MQYMIILYLFSLLSYDIYLESLIKSGGGVHDLPPIDTIMNSHDQHAGYLLFECCSRETRVTYSRQAVYFVMCWLRCFVLGTGRQV